MLLSANCFAELTMGAVMLANKKYLLLFYFEFFALLLVLLTLNSQGSFAEVVNLRPQCDGKMQVLNESVENSGQWRDFFSTHNY